MHLEGDELHADTDEARAASTPNVVRWVLSISLLAAILLLSAIWIFGAATQGESAKKTDASTRSLEDYGSRRGILPGKAGSTDGIVDERADEIDEPVTDPDTQGPGRVQN